MDRKTFTAAPDVAYALPRMTVPDERGTPTYWLDAAYEQRPETTARQQLARAVFRLAA